MPRSILKPRLSPAPVRYGTQVLRDYEHWLESNYGATATYLTHAKAFLSRFKSGGSLSTQLQTFSKTKSPTGRSLLNRFAIFIEEKNIDSLYNDFGQEKLPKAGLLVKLFLLSVKDRLKSKTSRQTYANVLNGYMKYVGELRHISKFTAERFIFDAKRSDFTAKLYISVIRNFSAWIVQYIEAPETELSPLELQIKWAFDTAQLHTLKQIRSIIPRAAVTTMYHKESLSFKERERLLKVTDIPKDRVILSLMAYNGLRPVEVTRLSVQDIDLKARSIKVWGKGKSSRHKDQIPLFKIPARELNVYLKRNPRKRGKLFEKLSYKKLHEIAGHYFDKIKVPKKREALSPHSLRHTAGQLLYDQGVPLEFIQRTLRHSSMESTMVYAQKAIEQAYFKKMKSF